MEGKELYHYTSVEGFKNIIENHALRLTESNFLNDPQDCKLFEKILKESIKDDQYDKAQEIIDSCNLKENKDKILRVLGKCSCEDYIDYLYKHIKLYVMSFSENKDDLSMWNYYGKGGFSIKIDKDELIKEIKNLLVENNEYFIFEKVIYSKNDTIDKIPDFNNIKFYNKDDEYVLTKNIEDSGQDENVKYLLDSAKLEIFYRVYYKAYLYSIKYLLTEKTITIDANKDIICQKIFENTLNLKKSMAWKRNLSIYMLFLTALIKSNSYESEKEVRLVYFKYDIDNDCKEDKVDFFTKYTSFGNLLSPCVYLKKGDCTGFEKIIKELIISPVSKNLTIGQEVYKDTLTRFLLHNHYEGTKIKYSKHNIRW